MMRLPAARLATALTLCALAAPLAACDDGSTAGDSEAAQRRTLAARRACVAAEVHRRALSDVRDLEETVAGTGSDSPAAEMTRRAGAAALEFARAFEQHAQLRTTAYAHMDSALNYSSRATDSVRHVEIARTMSIRTPEPGTLEANVVQAYEREINTLAGDQDHPCNWELETR